VGSGARVECHAPAFRNLAREVFQLLHSVSPSKILKIQILNALAGNYELSDEAGHSAFFTLATTGGSIQTVGFAATGTMVSITELTNVFAIDNVTFNQPPTDSVPEPSTWAMVLLGFAGVGFIAYRRKPNSVLMAA
jgi:hypothetical protein